MKKRINDFINTYCTVDYIFIFFIIVLMVSLRKCFDPGMYLTDLGIQIKAGEWIINNKQLITEDVFSWHEGLNWIPHEQAYYVFVYLLYNFIGTYSINIFIFIINILYLLCALLYNKKTSNTNIFCIFISFIICYTNGIYPMNNGRPETLSLLFMMFEILILLSDKSFKFKLISLSLLSWLTVLFHGGAVLVYFFVLGLYFILDLICNKSKTNIKNNLIIILVSFIFSLLTPQGIDMWTYNHKQSMYPDIRSSISEWQPYKFDVSFIIIIFITIIGAVLNDKFKERDLNTLFKIALICGFTVGCTIYTRMLRQLMIVMLLFAPYFIEIFFKYLPSFYFKTNLKLNLNKLKSVTFYVNFLLVLIIIFDNVNFMEYFVYNDINDFAYTEGYDTNVISFIKNKNYSKVFNDYNIGAWLLENDIKVHIDDRLDPYLESVSGEDHVHKEMIISCLDSMNRAYDLYKCDAFLVYYQLPDTEFLNNNDKDEDYLNAYMSILAKNYNIINDPDARLIKCIEDSNRYIKVYDNVTISKSISFNANNKPCFIDDYRKAYRFVIFENAEV